MVTFRFYVVSTVAFFLALAVGVVVGSVLDGQIADSLRDRLDGVEQSLDDTVDSIDAKNAELELQERYMADSAPFSVQDTMTATTTLVVAETGLDAASLEDLVRRLRQAGSTVEGVVWLDRRMDLAEIADRELVAGLIGAPTSTAPTELRTALWEAVLAPGADGAGEGGATTTVPEESAPDTTAPGAGTAAQEPTSTTTVAGDAPAEAGVVPLLFEQSPLAELADAGLVRLQRVEGAPENTAAELLVAAVTGPTATTDDPGLMVGEVAGSAAALQVPVVLGELHPSGEEGAPSEDRGGLLSPPEGVDAALISTVDDLEWLPGRVATVLALSELREGRSGSYGLGPDVDGLLPPWQGP